MQDRAINKKPVLVALDYASAAPALTLASQLDPADCRLKVGKELFTAAGPELIRSLVAQGFDVFLDMKFHDIPNTVAGAVRAAAELGVWMINVHASGGSRMMKAAADALAGMDKPPLLIAVTVLTSMDASDLAEIGISIDTSEQVTRLARLAQTCGLDGIVCSAQEAPAMRDTMGPNFTLVTPGIRPLNSAADDQRRIVTPAQAIANGSDYLVIGRPITQADDPQLALKAILQELV
ncbi:MAG: orotidine-5'-phosphate decarboxylase [Pseudomonadales bacterium]